MNLYRHLVHDESASSSVEALALMCESGIEPVHRLSGSSISRIHRPWEADSTTSPTRQDCHQASGGCPVTCRRRNPYRRLALFLVDVSFSRHTEPYQHRSWLDHFRCSCSYRSQK